jgi:hypothetical protein
MRDRAPVTQTVHLILPATRRPLCGYEDERPASEGARVACPECVALLRSGVAGKHASIRRGR